MHFVYRVAEKVIGHLSNYHLILLKTIIEARFFTKFECKRRTRI